MNASKIKCISDEIQRLEAMLCSGLNSGKSLIVSTGDISDVDGLYALAEYAKTGADVLFIMNYPAYLSSEDGDESTIGLPGQGYTYGTKKYLETSKQRLSETKSTDSLRAYTNMIKMYIDEERSVTGGIKRAFTEIAFRMITSVWSSGGASGKIFLCIGGVNSLNPFSAEHLKNELFVYKGLLDHASVAMYGFEEGDIFDSDGKKLRYGCQTFMDAYRSIRIDFNGSMAFMTSEWERCLENIAKRGHIKGVFVMGGVHSYATAKTMPSIPGVMNRFSCSTMNQLYSPGKTADFFNLVRRCRLPVYVVSNNSVLDFDTYESEAKTVKTDIGWESFLSVNGISLSPLRNLASAYYNSGYDPPRKPFDFYVALALHEHMRFHAGKRAPFGNDRKLFFDNVYGITIISMPDIRNWSDACNQYLGFIKKPNFKNEDFQRNIEDAIRKEKEILPGVACSNMNVFLVEFEGDDLTDLPLTVKKTTEFDAY